MLLSNFSDVSALASDQKFVELGVSLQLLAMAERKGDMKLETNAYKDAYATTPVAPSTVNSRSDVFSRDQLKLVVRVKCYYSHYIWKQRKTTQVM